MNEADAIDIIRSALWTVIAASGPPVLAAMIIGILIAFFQALTQIQEMTLTFVPKMIAVFVMIAVAGPFIGGQVLIFTEQAYSRVETGFNRLPRGGGNEQTPARNILPLRPGFTPAAPTSEQQE